MRKLLGAGVMVLLAASSGVAGDVCRLSTPALRSRLSTPKMSLVNLDPTPNQEGIVYLPDPVEWADPKLRAVLKGVAHTPAIVNLTVADFIDIMPIRFPDIKCDIDRKAFRRGGISPDDVLKREVVWPKGKLPFSQVLRDCLRHAKCDYKLYGDTIMIVPK